MENLGNPPTRAKMLTANIALTLMYLGTSSRRRLKNVTMTNSMSAVTAVIWFTVSYVAHVKKNMWVWPNANSNNVYMNTYVTYDPIGHHFSKVPHIRDPSKVKVHVLSFITHPPDSRTALNMRLCFELDWIHCLRTTLPRGLNAMD